MARPAHDTYGTSGSIADKLARVDAIRNDGNVGGIPDATLWASIRTTAAAVSSSKTTRGQT